MANVRAGIHFDENDEVDVDLMHVEGLSGPREVVNVTIGGVTLHFRAKDLELLRSLETCTAEARRDLEAVIAGLTPDAA